jgi:N-6 DNA Methylase
VTAVGQNVGEARVRELVREWRAFARSTKVIWNGQVRTWAEHVSGNGFEDEVRLIQRTVFPAFAFRFLGFEVGVNLSPEQSGVEGLPDFTPADPVTHPFVFETKSSRRGVDLRDDTDLAQVTRYLVDGRPRIRRVVLTNLVGLRVFELDESQRLREVYSVRLRDLLLLPEDEALSVGSARDFARFIDDFSRRELTPAEKIARIRAAHPWDPFFEVTSSEWVIRRLDRVVSTLQHDVLDGIHQLDDPTRVSATEQSSILDELHLLGSRLSEDLTDFSLRGFLDASSGTTGRTALEQYAMHVAYYMATRLLLIRTWEDLELLEPTLYDGGFDVQMQRFDDAIGEVVDHSYAQARSVYRSLFQHSNNYSWFSPSDDVYADAIYELAFTYLGEIDSDILGQVYERLLARIDRKLLGQYYTPRDIIGLIWDLINVDEIAATAEAEARSPRVLDIATGSGGFLVEVASRLRTRFSEQVALGAAINEQAWLNSLTEGINGVEIQYFSRYLGELNLLVQLGRVLASHRPLRLAPIGVVAADTLSLHEPIAQESIDPVATDQPERARLLKAVRDTGFLMDVACGNPPYIGEKLAAPILARTRRNHPYWEQFVAEHLDYLYWFLILGISKLRSGGRFGFITTEYWLRASGAAPLRRYVAQHCHVERVLLFRDLRLFPDAPGQHSMVVVGTRRTVAEADSVEDAVRPSVSIYEGPHIPIPAERAALLDAMRESRTAAQVRTFAAQVSPNDLRSGSWGDVILTRRQLRQRARLVEGEQLEVAVSKGVETTLNRLTSRTAPLLPSGSLTAMRWPDVQPGIQLLRSSELKALGRLNPDEARVMRPVVNTRDVYPYATVLPDEPDHVMYLVKPSSLGADTPMAQAVATAFPAGLPTLERHLERFQPVLTRATTDRNERRPWWSLHRPRFNIIGGGSDAEWEPYCLTTRWGGGNRLVVGLAPGGSSPASGLHILRPVSDAIGPAYLVALYNSSIYQAIVDTLPPGNIRAEELLRLGAPMFPGAVGELSAAGLALAEIVRTLIREDAQHFPLVYDALREDVTLSEVPLHTWIAREVPEPQRGRLTDVTWVSNVEIVRSPNARLGEVRSSETLLGRIVEVDGQATSEPAARIELAPDVPEEILHVLSAALRGAAHQQVRIRNVPSILVPVDPDVIVREYGYDCAAIERRVQAYRDLRSRVDSILDARLG